MSSKTFQVYGVDLSAGEPEGILIELKEEGGIRYGLTVWADSTPDEKAMAKAILAQIAQKWPDPVTVDVENQRIVTKRREESDVA